MVSERLLNIAAEAERELKGVFDELEKISFENTKRVLDTFREHRVSEAMLGTTTGYGYDDDPGISALQALRCKGKGIYQCNHHGYGQWRNSRLG